MSKLQNPDEEVNATLFSARNFFYIGNFVIAIRTVEEKTTPGSSDTDLLSYMYLSYLANDCNCLIASEIKENDSSPLLAIRHIYTYLTRPEKREEIMEIFSEKLMQDVGETNIWQVVSTIAYCHEGQYENALKVLHGSTDLECMALSICCLLRLNRVDLAKQILTKMQDKNYDATITQLAQAWVGIASGGNGLQEAFHIFQEFCENNQATPLLLNGQAVCHMGQERWEEAEAVLKEALSKKQADYNTLVNLVVLSHLSGKSNEILNRYLEQLRQLFPKSEFVVDYNKKDEEFDRLCLQYEPFKKIAV